MGSEMRADAILVKLYNKRRYAEDLINGELFANRLFRWKNSKEAGRGDELEGLFWLLQPSKGGELIFEAMGTIYDSAETLDALLIS